MGLPKGLLFGLYTVVFSIMLWCIGGIFVPNPARMGIVGLIAISVGVGTAYYRTYAKN
ncbi:hypothetical protein [Haladaptatus sp. DFWS20]|uniref:hypothetical protein n=1 Tax=Haladaptatus sp. DFWS20 TaxID=3403467 RepID=UPI003EB855C9